MAKKSAKKVVVKPPVELAPEAKLSRADILLSEALKWVDKIYIKRLEKDRQAFVKEAGDYLREKRNS